MAATFSQTHGTEHLKQLKEHSLATIKVGNVVSDFMRKKSALQDKYAAELSALVETCRIRTQPSQLQGVYGFEEAPLFSLWDDLRTLSLEESAAIVEQSAECRNTAADLSAVLTRKKRLMKLVFSDVQELERGVKSLEQACEKSRKANEESFKAAASAGQQPTGMMKKIADNKIVGSLFSKFTKDRAESKELTEHKTHNDYALQVISANEQKKKFHKTDLPKALTTAQEIYVAVTHETKESVAGYAEGLLRASAALTAIQQALLAKAEAISGEAAIGVVMSTLSIDVNAPGWTEVQFVSPETGDTGPARLQVSDAESVAVLEKRLANLERITTQLATDMSKQVKSVDGIEKLYNQYLSTPSFGSPDDVFEKLYMEKKQVRNILTLMQRNNAVIGALQDVNITADAVDMTSPDGSPIRANIDSMVTLDGEEEEWSGNDDSADEGDHGAAAIASTVSAPLTPQHSGPVRGLALYDYVPQGDEEIALVAGEVINGVETVDAEWWRGNVANRSGLFPASYCHVFTGEPEHQVLAMYDYAAQNETELTVAADSILTVLEPEQDGWTMVLREADQARGLVPSTYIDPNFAKQAPSVMTPSMASGLAGFLDDLDLDGETEEGEYVDVEATDPGAASPPAVPAAPAPAPSPPTPTEAPAMSSPVAALSPTAPAPEDVPTPPPTDLEPDFPAAPPAPTTPSGAGRPTTTPGKSLPTPPPPPPSAGKPQGKSLPKPRATKSTLL